MDPRHVLRLSDGALCPERLFVHGSEAEVVARRMEVRFHSRAIRRLAGWAFLKSDDQRIYDGMKHRPEATQGTGLADIMAYKDPTFVRRDFSSLMLKSPWANGKK